MIISVFMLGIGLGAIIGGALADRSKDCRRLYFLVELVLGGYGFLSIPILNLLANFTAGSSSVVALGCMSLFLCLPTLAMGMTLPIVVSVIRPSQSSFLSSLSFLYTVNTLGGAIGALFGTFIINSFFGIDTTIYSAVAIDVVLAFLLLRGPSSPTMEDQSALVNMVDEKDSAKPKSKYPYASGLLPAPFWALISGFLAIGYEVVLFRFLDVLSKSSPYTFASNLAYYLCGIALGSSLTDALLTRWKRSQQEKDIPSVELCNLFFFLQAATGLYILTIFTLYYHTFNYPPISSLTAQFFENFYTGGTAVGGTSALAGIIFAFIPCTIMGASFPLLGALAYADLKKTGKAVGITYFANTIGNLFGGLVVGYLFLPLFSTEGTLLLLGSIGLLCPIACINLSGRLKPALFLVLGILLAFFNLGFPKKHQIFLAMHTSALPESFKNHPKTYIEEGADGLAILFESGNYFLNYINGYAHGTKPNYKYHREFFEALAHFWEAQNVLIVGFGAGTTTETVLKLPQIKKVTLVEICRSNLRNVQKSPINACFKDPRLKVVDDDGRRFLLATKEKFDLILLDPLRAREAYSNNLYSREFFELAREHLSEKGVLLVWLDEFHVIPHTAASAFESVKLYNYFLIASKSKLTSSPEIKSFLQPFYTEEELKETWKTDAHLVGDRRYIIDNFSSYPTNSDLKPVCEYYIGLQLFEARQKKPH